MRFGLGIGEGHFIQAPTNNPGEAFMQNIEAFYLGRCFAPHPRPGQYRRHFRARIAHALFGGEHVILIQVQLDFEDLPLAIIPGERDGLAGRQRSAADLPIRLPIRNAGATIGRSPAPLREIRGSGIARREKPHGGGAGVGGFAVAQQHQIIQPCATKVQVT